MSRLDLAQRFVDRAQHLQNLTELGSVLEEICRELGFSYYALVHHADLRSTSPATIRLENYPSAWSSYFVETGLYAVDPIHRACSASNVGFRWADVPNMLVLTGRQRGILESAARYGLGDGYTVPANIPGERSGSCSFATRPGQNLDEANLILAHLVGGFAFQAARRLTDSCPQVSQSPPRLTPRQRDCLLLAIQGKTDWEIGRILDLSEETVSQHLDMARERYGVTKRLPLAIRAIFDGQISFVEALSWQFPLKRE